MAVLLYATHLSKLGSQLSGPAAQGQGFYLRNSYFDSSHINALHFIFARTGGVFQYIFSQLVIGDLAFLFFFAGIVILWRNGNLKNTQLGRTVLHGRLLAGLLTLPFVIACVAALVGKYPYGGTRHDAFLIPFAIAGVSFALARFSAGRFALALIVSLLIAGLCNVFPTHRQPYIARVDQSSTHMDEAVKFIQTQVSPSEPIFSDFQSRLLLEHYLCDQNIVAYDKSTPGFISAECHGLRMIATTANTFTFTPQSFASNWNKMIPAVGLKPGEKVWIAQEGWNIHLPNELKQFQEFKTLDVHYFGYNIAMFQLTVGQPLPNSDQMLN
jgi:hypothetical protein